MTKLIFPILFKRGLVMNIPLADRLRPKSIEDIVGQKHLIADGKPLRKIIDSGEVPNLIFYGPSGVGKTTLAAYIARPKLTEPSKSLTVQRLQLLT